jgi:hypothetical protein
MAKSKNQKQHEQEDGDAIMERMNKALKEMMQKPHETQKEMVERRRRQGERASSSRKSAKSQRRCAPII